MAWLALLIIIVLCMVFGVRAVLAGLAFAALLTVAGVMLIII